MNDKVAENRNRIRRQLLMAQTKTDATVLAVVHHPALRDMSEGVKSDIAKMINALGRELVPGALNERTQT